jgi:hypothetical protein
MKKKCVVCGKQATHDCDQTMGALCCGASLCNDCVHITTLEGGGGHGTKKQAAKFAEQMEREVRATIASRTSPIQRKDADSNPLNLFELLKDPTGYTLTEIFYLELHHGLLGVFPAMLNLEGGARQQMIVTPDKELLKEVWGTLERRDSKMNSVIGYANGKFGYMGAKGEVLETERVKANPLLTRERYAAFKALAAKSGDKAFDWRLGLMGGRTLSEEEFANLIAKA